MDYHLDKAPKKCCLQDLMVQNVAEKHSRSRNEEGENFILFCNFCVSLNHLPLVAGPCG